MAMSTALTVGDGVIKIGGTELELMGEVDIYLAAGDHEL